MWQSCPYPPIRAARWSPPSCRSTCWEKRYSWRTTGGRKIEADDASSGSFVLASVLAAVPLNLQRGVLDLKTALEIRGERGQECIFRAPVWHDQVRGQGN